LATTFLSLGFFTFSIFFTREPSIVMDRGDKRVLNLSLKAARALSSNSAFLPFFLLHAFHLVLYIPNATQSVVFFDLLCAVTMHVHGRWNI
jgi:hypothetical protein